MNADTQARPARTARRRVAVLGATGAVGQTFVRMLADHPWFELVEVGASERSAGKTYAEVIDDATLGLPYKIEHLSQSSRAMLEFLNFRRSTDGPELWRWR